MNVVEKIAYTKGFFSGLDIDGNTKEGKAFHALLDLLEELVVSNVDLEQQCDRLKSQVSEIDEHVSEVFNNVFDNASYNSEKDTGHTTDLFEVICPECETKTTFGQSVALQGRMDCPGCGIRLDFDYDDTPDEAPAAVETAMPALSPEMEELSVEAEVAGTAEPELNEEQTEEPVAELFPEPEIAFTATPPIPASEGESDQIPQTADFVYSESTEEDENSAERAETRAETYDMMPQILDEFSEMETTIQTEEPDQAETKSEEELFAEASEEEVPDARSALVKVDFAAEPEAFEAGKKKGSAYKFSTENVTLDFAGMIPDVPEMSSMPEA